MLHSWSFAQLRDFITYKARRAGVPVVVVDPAYTSQSATRSRSERVENKAMKI
jgi:transposase